MNFVNFNTDIMNDKIRKSQIYLYLILDLFSKIVNLGLTSRYFNILGRASLQPEIDQLFS